MKKQCNEEQFFEEAFTQKQQVAVREIEPPCYQYEFSINKEIRELDEYENLINALRSATDRDVVVLTITSPGGNLHTAQMIISEIESTSAYTVALVVGEASSAASMIALSCCELVAEDDSTWLLHDLSTGVGGKSSDIASYVDHMKLLSKRVIRKYYNGFLNEEVIAQILNGRQVYMFGDEIMQLWSARQERLAAEREEALQEQEEDTTEGCEHDCLSCSCKE